MNEVPRVQLHSSVASSGWSFRAAPARQVLRCDASGHVTLRDPAGVVLQSWDEPLGALRWLSETSIPADHRWIGYLSYDLGRWFEHLPQAASDDLHLPLFVFSLHGPRPADSSDNPAAAGSRHDRKPSILRSSFTREQYLRAVQRSIDYIAAGDIFQVNLSQRFSVGLPCPPEQVWSRLLASTPSQYGAYLDYGDFALISNSPELFLRVTPDRRVVTRPIKGTRPRRPGMDVELRDSIKDQAELHMIVDLERNDLGRVCRIGTVRVTEPRVIEPHPTVYHGVATVEGQLREDVGFVDLLKATFPGGSITGAPKIRAMEIIDQLEPVRRGPYCGAIGYLAADRTVELNIAIRTMIVAHDQVHIPVGGGIVADSLPQSEYDETLVKAQAMFAALGIT